MVTVAVIVVVTVVGGGGIWAWSYVFCHCFKFQITLYTRVSFRCACFFFLSCFKYGTNSTCHWIDCVMLNVIKQITTLYIANNSKYRRLFPFYTHKYIPKQMDHEMANIKIIMVKIAPITFLNVPRTILNDFFFWIDGIKQCVVVHKFWIEHF